MEKLFRWQRRVFDDPGAILEVFDFLIAERKTLANDSPQRAVRLNSIGRQAAAEGWVGFFARCGDAFFDGHKRGYWIRAQWSSEDLDAKSSAAFHGSVTGGYQTLVKLAISGDASSKTTLNSYAMQAEILTAGAEAPKIAKSIGEVENALNDFAPKSPIDIAWTIEYYKDVAIDGLPAWSGTAAASINELQSKGSQGETVAGAVRQKLADLSYVSLNPHEFGEQNFHTDTGIPRLQNDLRTIESTIEQCYLSHDVHSTPCNLIDQLKAPEKAPPRGQWFSGQDLTPLLRGGRLQAIPYTTTQCWKLVNLLGSYSHYNDPRFYSIVLASDGLPSGPTLVIQGTNPGEKQVLNGVHRPMKLPPGAKIAFMGAQPIPYTYENDTPNPPDPIRLLIYYPQSNAEFAAAGNPTGFSNSDTYPPCSD